MSDPQITAFGTSVYIKQTPQALGFDAASAFQRLAKQAAAVGRPFRVALSGGSTPKLLYERLVVQPFRSEIPWENIEFFFGDERWVPHDHPDSNYKLAKDELLDKLGISPDKVFPMPTEGLSPEEAAQQYEATLRERFGTAEGEIPSFDLILLGIGEDGHTTSTFPGSDVLDEQEKLVAAPYVEKLATHRITLTPPVLSSAANTLVMVTGESKAPAVWLALEGEYNPDACPSQLLRDALGKVVWLVSKEAASELEGEYPQT